MLTAVRSVCYVSAGIFLLRFVTDGTRLKKQAAFVMKLVFAVVFASAVIKGFMEFELPEISQYEASDYSQAADRYRKEAAEKAAENISDVLCSQLEAAGIDVKELQTEVNISEDGSIDISRVIVRSADPAAAAELIRKSLGQETEVINETD
ncbi:MAG: hypothetical protein IKW96_03515 [Ruminococcus sp.]|uniref:hypothetical protein n=1 Tax=Ruminococcus sp. TaxID=41978 RepID=UPI0025DE1E9E|nr:hypothetical protein [Ruminococcus sp.]MBR5682338.1 hypothetical protein [Ruminococcus sp.]